MHQRSFIADEVGWRVEDREIVDGGAALVELQLLHQSGRTEMLETTDEHPFSVIDSDARYGTTWTRVDGLAPGDQVKTLTGYATVTELRFTDRRTTVYNFSPMNRPSTSCAN